MQDLVLAGIFHVFVFPARAGCQVPYLQKRGSNASQGHHFFYTPRRRRKSSVLMITKTKSGWWQLKDF